MSRVTRAFLIIASCLAGPAAAAAGERPPQAVIISFDGAGPISQWQRSRTLAARTGATFTYFLSCVYLLTDANRDVYKPPRHKAGRSEVGVAESTADVRARLDQIRQAAAEGHDIASHGCGHFDGADWSKAEWMAEFDAFDTVLRDAWSLNGLGEAPADWAAIAGKAGRSGFRAPYLATGRGLYAALAEKGFGYDASGVSQGPAMPDDGKGPVRFALPMIPEGPRGRPVIAMDYNLFARHTKAVEAEDRDGAFEQRSYDAFRAAFDAQFAGKRIPLEIGFHFTLMNGGAYWRALERFAGEVCVMPDVACVSYADWIDRFGASAAPAPSGAGMDG